MTIPDDRFPLSIKLSREELFVILKLLKASAGSRLDLSWFQEEDDETSLEECEQALNVAVGSLVTRNYLKLLQPESEPQMPVSHQDDEQQQREKRRVGVSSEVLALVGVCISAPRNLFLTWQTSKRSDRIAIHERDGLLVAHTNSSPGINTFTFLKDWEAALNVISHVLGLKEQRASLPPLPAATLQLAVLVGMHKEVHQHKIDQIPSWLIQRGLPISIAQTFLHALKEARGVAGFTFFQRDAENPTRITRKKLSLIVTGTTCFLLAPIDTEGEYLRLCQLSAQEVQEQIGKAMYGVSQSQDRLPSP